MSVLSLSTEVFISIVKIRKKNKLFQIIMRVSRAERLRAIGHIEAGRRYQDVAVEFRVNKSTISHLHRRYSRKQDLCTTIHAQGNHG